ncbi:MAG: MFS transporter [Lawsonibacter sp.]|nr:MFS transporter [Lawsonibacter sp.]
MEPKRSAAANYIDGIKVLMTNKNYILMMLISMCNSFALSTSKTTLSLYGKGFGMDGRTLGMMTGTYYLICLICRPFTGSLVDKLNKKLVMTGCLVVKIVSWAIYALCQNPTMFTVARYIDAVAFCLITSCFLGASSTLIDKKSMGTGLAVYGSLPGVFTFMAPVLGEWMHTNLGGRTVYYFGIVCEVIAIVLIQMLDFSKTEGKARPSKKFSFNDLIYLPAVPVCLSSFFLNLILTVNDVYLLLYCAEKGIEGAAIYFSIISATRVIAGLVFGSMSDLVGTKPTLIICCVATAISTAMIGMANNLGVLAVSAFIAGVANNGSKPVLQKAATDVAPREKFGVALSTNYFIFDCASTFAGYIAAFFVGALGYVNTYYAMAAFPIVGMIFVIFAFRAKPEEAPAA